MSCPSRCLITWPLFHRSLAGSREGCGITGGAKWCQSRIHRPVVRETPWCNTLTRTWTRIKKQVIKIGRHWGEVIEILWFPRNRQRPGTSVSIWGREADEYHTLRPGEENCPFSGRWFEVITRVGHHRPPNVALLVRSASSFLVLSGSRLSFTALIVCFPSTVVLHTVSKPAGYHEPMSQKEFY